MTVDFKTTTIGCPDCRVNGRPQGYKLNVLTGNHDKCRTCDGTEQIYVCDSFTVLGKGPVLRYTKCDHCHATQSQHIDIARYVALVQ